MGKLRVLWNGESSFMHSGYSVYGQELLSRLHRTGKYEIAELGAYASPEDPRIHSVQWRFYPNVPRVMLDGQINPEFQAYDQDNSDTKFNAYSFNDVVIDFKPHVVLDIRDWWMLRHALVSPLRKYYQWFIMPTVDSAPQEDEWIDGFINADAVLCYSEWAQNVLRKQGGGKINLVGTAPPAANYNIYKPIANKKEHKVNMGFPADSLIIGSIMRNQKRKLIPDLIEAFEKYLEMCRTTGQKDRADRSLLYLHTTFPDVGWDLPKLIKQHNVANKLIVTYTCDQCKTVFPSLFQDVRTTCKRCGTVAANIPHTGHGISTESLSFIVNLFDVYIQYAICEGWGMPQIEAAACGVPVMAVDYSAMEDINKHIKGIPIPVQRMFLESETHAYRAYPDNDALVKGLYSFFSLSEADRERKGKDIHTRAMKTYNYNDVVKTWMSYLDTIDVVAAENKWRAGPDIFEVPEEIRVPNSVRSGEFVEWAISNILQDDTKIDSYFAMLMTRNLNYNKTPLPRGGIYFNEHGMVGHRGYMDFNRENLIQMIVNMRQDKNYWERVRCRMIPHQPKDAVRFVKP